MGHWTPTGVEPKDYDDDDDSVSIGKKFKASRYCRHLLYSDPVVFN